MNVACCRYDPGDIAVIHPEAAPADVETFLASIGYSNIADEPITIRHSLSGLHSFINLL